MKLPDFRKIRGAMIDSQLRPSGINDPALIAAIRYVPREMYVPADMSALAYRDEAIEVVPGRYLVAPLLACQLIAAIEPMAGDHVLVIGGTTGYSTAILARFIRHVTHVENDPTLVRRADSAISKTGLGNVEIVEGVLAEGHAAGAPYDALIIEGAVEFVPEALAAQVRDGGRIATVIAAPGSTPQLSAGCVSGGHIGWTALSEANAPPVEGFARERAFEF